VQGFQFSLFFNFNSQISRETQGKGTKIEQSVSRQTAQRGVSQSNYGRRKERKKGNERDEEKKRRVVGEKKVEEGKKKKVRKWVAFRIEFSAGTIVNTREFWATELI
jgi:hypothetical protein